MSNEIIKELLKPTEFDYIGAEKDFEQYVVENIDELAFYCGWGDVARVKTQFILPYKNGKPRCDVMVWHKDGTGTIIECKIGGRNGWMLAAIGQCLFYREMCHFKLKEYPRIVLASNDISAEVYSVISSYKLPINLMQIDAGKVIYV